MGFYRVKEKIREMVGSFIKDAGSVEVSGSIPLCSTIPHSINLNSIYFIKKAQFKVLFATISLHFKTTKNDKNDTHNPKLYFDIKL